MKDAAAIIVAGGQGKRFGGKVRKQYLALKGRPILWWSVNAFRNSPSIGAIVLVVPQDDLLRVRKQFPGKNLQVVPGGKTRADSVRRGLAAVPSGWRWVAVHDAVRPLVTVPLIEQVLKQARSHRAAIAAIPSKDTVKIAAKTRTIQRTLPRDTVWLAQTPQAFERKLLEKAHGRKSRGDLPTDDSMMVERLGVRVKLVQSPGENLKVTVPMDLDMAEEILRKRR